MQNNLTNVHVPLRLVLTALVAGGVLLTTTGIAAVEPGKTVPATVAKPGKETDLLTLTLTPQAEQRLGIVIVPAKQGKLARYRAYSGEIILPLRTGTNATGQAMAGSQSILSILPSLSPTDLVRIAETQIDAESQIERAKAQLAAAQTTLERSEQLLRDKAGSARGQEDAKLQVALAESGLRAAQARRELLGPPVLDPGPQKLFWVRVPVYVGDVEKLNSTSEAGVGGLTRQAGALSRPAKPLSALPSANAQAASVDLFYAVDNTDGTLRVGQRVGVTIPLKEEKESLLIPWASVVQDIYGGSWVYEKTAPSVFIRRRVRIQSVVGEVAAVEGAIKVGSKLVTDGAAELFGTEFGVGK